MVTPPPVSGFRQLTDRLVALSTTPYALWAMALVAVVDGSIFPVPPFALLVPMVLAQPHKALKFALVGTIASLIGGALGYALGHAISLGLTSAFSVDPNLPIHFNGNTYTLAQVLGQNFWLLALACSILPTPYKVVAIGSGLVGVPLPAFFAASVLGRSARFFAVSYVLVLFGTRGLRWLGIRTKSS